MILPPDPEPGQRQWALIATATDDEVLISPVTIQQILGIAQLSDMRKLGPR
jgi:hypothetical protein